MKIFISLLIAIVIISCSPDDAIPEMAVTDNFDPTHATLLRHGMLEGVNHVASGTVSIFSDDGNHVVVLDPFESENGPDLKVYLSKSVDATEYINLGQLKSTMGKQSYNIPAGTDVNKYQFVLIWCEKYSVIFAKSEPR